MTSDERLEINRHRIAYQSNYQRSLKRSSSSWSSIGPYDWDHEAASKSYAPGAAHVYTVEQSKTEPDVLYAGTATAGLWKSIDHGDNWNCLTCELMINGVYALDIHPLSGQVVLAELFDNIYKTTDGGSNWLPTGDASFQSLSLSVYDILFHPTNSSIAFAGTSNGLYRTTNGGSSWTQILTDNVQEIEVHPTNSMIWYAIRQKGDVTEFYRSTNDGVSFALQTGGWPAPNSPDHNRRAEIAVSVNAPDQVVALLTGAVNGGTGLYGIYNSSDQGSNWTFSCCGPQPGGLPDLGAIPPNINTMAWSDMGSDDGGQYYYDVGLAVSPNDADSIFIAGVNMWVSGDGGATFTCPAKWSHSGKANYIHADIHDVNYYNNGELWVACDGGIFHSTDNHNTVQRKMTGIHGTDLWGFGANFWSGGVMLGGAFHNGTLLKNEDVYINGWLCTDGGDGTGGFANVGVENRVYSNYNIKDLHDDRNSAIPTRSYIKKPYSHYIIGRSSNLAFHPQSYSTQYFGEGECLYMTDDDHYTLGTIHCFGEEVADLEVSWVNPDYIYVATFPSHWGEKKLYRTVDGGVTWTDITPGTSVFSTNRWLPYDLSLSDTDPNIVYMARVANSVASYDGQKVYKSLDGGNTWINLTTSDLDGEQLSNIVYQRGTQDGLWIGTRRTVYYKSANFASWQFCNSGLPASTFSTKLVLNYRTQKIRNGTNRSVYEMPFVEASSPSVEISVDKLSSDCSRDTFYFSDYSALSESGVSWLWSFPGAHYVSSNTSRTPKVVYGLGGMYDVSLSIADANGSDQETLSSFIQVSSLCDVDTIPGQALSCESMGDYMVADLGGIQITNFTVSAWVKPASFQPDFTGIFMGGVASAGFNFKNGDNTLGYHWPGGQWWWNSVHKVPVDQWSHVALVARPTGITLYLNGVPDQHNISLSPAEFHAIHLGSYYGWASRNYTGQMDEVGIWRRALSTDEIRHLMHTTHDKMVHGPATDTDFIAYYQFNESSGNEIFDRVGVHHGHLSGSASRLTSTNPIGGGSASTQIISSTGSYLFANEGIRLVASNSAGIPNGPVVVSKINLIPNHAPSAYPLAADQYFAIHSFGNGDNLIIDSLFVYDENMASNICTDYFHYDRAFYAESDSWLGPKSIGEHCQDNWVSFPSDTLVEPMQFALTHYEGNFYVNHRGEDGNGSSWSQAFKQLQDAVFLAGHSDTIFVAEGTYYPRASARHCSNCGSLRHRLIQPRSSVTLLGGFPSSGGTLAQRDWEANPTTISGQTTNNSAENVYHVLYVDSLSADIYLNGFFITNGKSDGPLLQDKNGSALFAQGQASFTDVEFSGHAGDSSVFYIYSVQADILFERVRAINNSSGSALIHVQDSAQLYLDSVQVDNGL